MRFVFAVVVLSAVTIGLSAAPVPKEKEKEKAKDEDAILGRWNTVTVERPDGKAPGPGVMDRSYTFEKDGKLTLSLGGGQSVTVDYKLDPGASPKTIDLLLPAGGMNPMTIPGIYELDGDTLKLCLTEGGEKPVRPQQMKANRQGEGVITFKRAKVTKQEKKDE